MLGKPFPEPINQEVERLLTMRRHAKIMLSPPELISSSFRVVCSPTKYMFEAVANHVKFLDERAKMRGE